MTISRSEVVREGIERVYHCISRCVRRAFLCGHDSYTGKSFEHRKEWIRSRLEDLAGAFAIEVCAYAIMSNHLHVILRTRPDWQEEWSDAEVARQWLKIFPKRRNESGKAETPSEEAIRILTQNADLMAEVRQRLGSVSWFMRCVNETVARRANQEDGCKGRFWEGRFKCQALLDEAAELACMTYVDLNPIRARQAERPEESEYTSAFERIAARQSGPKSNDWLCPIGDEGGANRRGLFSLSVDEYLNLLDWTGRMIRGDKKGHIPEQLTPILIRLAIKHDRWLDTVSGFGRLFHRVAGRVESIVQAAREAGRQWLCGLKAGREAFSAA